MQPQAKDEKIVRFHRQRRMFAVVKGELLVAREFDERDHETWARHDGWHADYEYVTRGFVDETGVYVYRGSLYEPSLRAEDDLAEHADLIAFLANDQIHLPIWNGMRPGAAGERWKPMQALCTVGELLEKREVVMIPVRIRPEVYERFKKVFVERDAITRFVGRAVAANGEAKTLELLRKECRPHERNKIGSGAQSSELFECKRCGAQWWD